MALPPETIRRISDKAGYPVDTLPGVRQMMDDVKKKTSITLSRNTLRRLFGLDPKPVIPRVTTLNAIAVAIGYPDWARFRKDKPALDEGLYPEMTFIHDMTLLKKGVLVEIRWNPDRRLLLEHLGDGRYKVIVSENAKLRKDDILNLGMLTVGFPFEALNVIREKEDIGPYHAAARSAIEELRFFPNDSKCSH